MGTTVQHKEISLLDSQTTSLATTVHRRPRSQTGCHLVCHRSRLEPRASLRNRPSSPFCERREEKARGRKPPPHPREGRCNREGGPRRRYSRDDGTRPTTKIMTDRTTDDDDDDTVRAIERSWFRARAASALATRAVRGARVATLQTRRRRVLPRFARRGSPGPRRAPKRCPRGRRALLS